MRHLYLLIFTTLLYSNAVSQNDLLGTWYLHSLTIDSSEEVNMFNGNSHIIFNNSGGIDGDAICNSFSGTSTVIDNSTIDIYIDGWTLIECTQESYNFYEYKYETIMNGYDTPYPSVFSYLINGTGNDEVLTLTDANSNILSYGRQPYPAFNLFGTWVLDYIVFDGNQLDNNFGDDFFIQFKNVSIEFPTGLDYAGSAVCNWYVGSYEGQHNTITMNDFIQSLVGCEPAYEGQYFSIITDNNQTAENPPGELDYEIIEDTDGESLIITNSLGNQAVYGRQALSIDKFSQKDKVSLFPNPSTDVIHIKGLNEENARYSIISIQGKVIVANKILSNKRISTTAMLPGLYFIQLKQGSITETLKFIKE